jgi:glycosyltransferase involved in cell wall biosynthesis
VKILFLSLSGLTFDVTTPEKEPLGGTESSFCYLSRELAKSGHDVTLCAKNTITGELCGVKHIQEVVLSDYDILISNAPIKLAEGKKPYYIFWNHLAHFDNAIKSLLFRDVFDGIDCIVYVSQWQRNECEKWFGRAKRTEVIGNGLTPAFENMFSTTDELRAAKENRAAYTSTPFRGLRMLPEIWPNISDGCVLDVYSGMRVYQGPDDGYKGIYDACRNTRGINYIGPVSQTELAQRMKKTAFLAYPCVFPETYCIAVLEAMASGCRIITSDLGALTETLKGWGTCISLEGAYERFVRSFIRAVNDEIEDARENRYVEVIFNGIQYANTCTWERRAEQWSELFDSVRQTASKSGLSLSA